MKNVTAGVFKSSRDAVFKRNSGCQLWNGYVETCSLEDYLFGIMLCKCLHISTNISHLGERLFIKIKLVKDFIRSTMAL